MHILVPVISILVSNAIIMIIIVTVRRENTKKTLEYNDKYFVMQTSRIVFHILLTIGVLLNLALITMVVLAAVYALVTLIITLPISFTVLYFFDKLLIGGYNYSLIIDGQKS